MSGGGVTEGTRPRLAAPAASSGERGTGAVASELTGRAVPVSLTVVKAGALRGPTAPPPVLARLFPYGQVA